MQHGPMQKPLPNRVYRISYGQHRVVVENVYMMILKCMYGAIVNLYAYDWTYLPGGVGKHIFVLHHCGCCVVLIIHLL
jgi:hypothetical protein